jgi:hypothetical protein
MIAKNPKMEKRRHSMFSFTWDRGKSGKDNLRVFRVGINPQEPYFFGAHMRHASADYYVPIFFDLDFTAADLEKSIGALPQGVTLVPIERLLMKVLLKQWTESPGWVSFVQ